MPSPLLPRPLVYAHRGGAALRPENTLLAFDHARALGADGLELDVRLSRDGVVVVHHDASVDRTTDGHGAVCDFSAAELAALDAGARFDPGGTGEFPYRGRGAGVPDLQQVLHRYPDISVIVELKTGDPALAERTVAAIVSAGAADRVAIGSFHPSGVEVVRRIEPRIRTGATREETRWALYRSWMGLPPGRAAYDEFQVPERSGRTRVVSARFVAHAHRAGIAVKVWTVDERAAIDRLLDWGVDAIITDRPDVAVPAVAERHATGQFTRPGARRRR